ncbi:MAG TPA: alpha-D-ribose 1-methylphosphonate 5-triphosphate diphosphatase [Puia sp.]|nr:alpha-D-ribose 1-methylphosphonate 5-triphosphate diphosphatase [Puia sp.]
MNSFLIKNAQVVTPYTVIPNGSVWVEGDRIRQVGTTITEPGSSIAKVIDAGGAYVMPGIIDIHTDAMDVEIVPRPGADIPVAVAFRELERKMCSCGITTVYHSLHLGYEVAELVSHSKYSRADVFNLVHGCGQRPTLIRNKIHLRFELGGVGAYEQCLELIRGGYIDLLSVMDHTPGQGQWSKESFKRHVMAKGKTEEEFEEELMERMRRPKIEGDRLETLVRVARQCGLPVASHDDDTVEKVDAMLALGVSICEFPINMETARYAMQMGMHVAGGASNILRGGSMSGNLDMTTAVREGAVDVLCSDYYPAAILHSVFKLHRQGMPLHEAANLATLHAAESVGLEQELGSLEIGKTADLLIVRLQDELPMITHSMVDGVLVMQTATK